MEVVVVHDVRWKSETQDQHFEQGVVDCSFWCVQASVNPAIFQPTSILSVNPDKLLVNN